MLPKWIAWPSIGLALTGDGSPPPNVSAPMTNTSVAEGENHADLDRLMATYGFVGGERELQALTEAIESVVREMNILVRAIARERLRETNKAPASLRMQRKGRKMTVTLDERSYTAELDGPPVEVIGKYGDRLHLRYSFRNKRLIQTFEGERGNRTNTFFIDEGGKLRLDVQVLSPKLPQALRYRLSFGKRG